MSSNVRASETAGQLKKTGIVSRHARIWMRAVYIFSDLICLLIAFIATLLLWSQINSDLDFRNYLHLYPVPLFFLLTYAVDGLYSLSPNAVDELRRFTLATSLNFLVLAALTFWSRSAILYSRASFIIAWIFILALLPTGRALVRTFFTHRGIWGEPVVIFGFGPSGYQLTRFLVNSPKLGLVPFLAVQDEKPLRNDKVLVPVVSASQLNAQREPDYLQGIHTAILIPSEIPKELLEMVVDRRVFHFSRLILISDNIKSGSVWVQPYDIGGILGLEVRQNLASKPQQITKRLMDVIIVIVSSPILLPVFACISLLIKLDSPGNILYSHTRIGQDRKKFNALKFRTMVSDSDQVLQDYLENNPEMKEEWQKNHKLKQDPRITRVGRILRKASLDEIPQVWNVLAGEMSLVGPRPIVDEEIRHYDKTVNLYIQVKPGMTGLWQVSGRNNIGYKRRVLMDEYYIRNWSIWLDIYILIKTIFAVLRGEGAY
jgi:Undecaprenyl-phosphate galactose phosphotransferase WbaP